MTSVFLLGDDSHGWLFGGPGVCGPNGVPLCQLFGSDCAVVRTVFVTEIRFTDRELEG